MARLRVHNFTVSLDGFAAGLRQGPENPLGEGGLQLHEWIFQTKSMRQLQRRDGGEVGVNDDLFRARTAGAGATIMGRNMFGPVREPGPMSRGGAGGARTRRSATTCSCSPTTPAPTWPCATGRPSASSTRRHPTCSRWPCGSRRAGRRAWRRSCHHPAVPGGRAGRRDAPGDRARPARRGRATLRRPSGEYQRLLVFRADQLGRHRPRPPHPHARTAQIGGPS